MTSGFVIRPADVADAAAMARVHVRSWQETYRGLMPDALLDDPHAVPTRERFWTAALTDPRYAANRAAVAVRDGTVIGVAMAGPPLDEDAARPVQLYVLYVLAAEHGSGAGPALLGAVLPADRAAVLWVADPNPRAQTFYRKHGFRPDGTARLEHGVRELRMRRPAASPRSFIRLARPEDLDHLQQLEDAADALLIAALRPAEWGAAPTGAERAEMPGFLLVAAEEPDGTAVGFAHVLEIDGHAHLEQLSVAPPSGRRGHGRDLVEAAKREAARRGHDRITLRTYADLPWNAPFYRRCGFAASEPDTPFLRGLVATEARLGLDRWGPRLQMTAMLPAADR